MDETLLVDKSVSDSDNSNLRYSIVSSSPVCFVLSEEGVLFNKTVNLKKNRIIQARARTEAKINTILICL